MYSTKEKLRILREIHNPAAAGADISLLRTVAPGEPGLVRFGLSPEKHTDDILMALLQCGVSREDIVANRRQFMKSVAEPETETQEPETVSGAEASAEGGEQSPEGPDDSPESQESEVPSESESVPEAQEPETETQESEPEAQETEPEAKKKSAKSRSTRP